MPLEIPATSGRGFAGIARTVQRRYLEQALHGSLSGAEIARLADPQPDAAVGVQDHLVVEQNLARPQPHLVPAPPEPEVRLAPSVGRQRGEGEGVRQSARVATGGRGTR
jgi:hypothetical protein